MAVTAQGRTAQYEPLKKELEDTEDEGLIGVLCSSGSGENLDGGRSRCKLPSSKLPWFPPKGLIFELFFFRRLFDRLKEAGITTKDGRLHLSVLRNVNGRLLDAIQIDGLQNWNAGFFGRKWPKKMWYTWQDVCKELTIEGCPEIRLNLAERIYMTMDNPTSSRMASCVSVFYALIIILNLVLIVVATLPNSEDPFCIDPPPAHKTGSVCGAHIQNFCVLLFTFEYLLKLVTVGFVRLELFDSAVILEQAVPMKGATSFTETPPLGFTGRILHYVFSPMNMVDLVSIMPFWMSIALGNLLPSSSTSFLRILRVARIFRILKTGRYLEILQVLLRTLAKSVRSITVLMIFIVIVALIAGVILQQVETQISIGAGSLLDDGSNQMEAEVDDARRRLAEAKAAASQIAASPFQTVPHAFYWVLARLVSVKDAPAIKGEVTTMAGIVLLLLLMPLKGVLWILPIGQIKKAFDEEYKAVMDNQAMMDSMEYEMTRSPWTHWYGLEGSARSHIEVWEDTPGGGQAGPKFTASMPVPILQVVNVPASPMTGRDALHFHEKKNVPWWYRKTPKLDVIISWTAAEQMAEDPHEGKASDHKLLPQGNLRVQILKGRDFPGDLESSKQWRLRMAVPVALQGDDSVETREVVSKFGGSSPDFSVTGHDCALDFEIRWAPSADGSSGSLGVGPSPSAGGIGPSLSMLNRSGTRESIKDDTEEGHFRRRALALLEAQSNQLEEQNKRLVALEKRLQIEDFVKDGARGAAKGGAAK